jgi:hypothetical protein
VLARMAATTDVTRPAEKQANGVREPRSAAGELMVPSNQIPTNYEQCAVQAR